jgi:probable HAF family extracellular repeat protein
MLSPRKQACVVAIGLLVAGAASGQNRPDFDGVGDLAGGIYYSETQAVADDGSVVVGGSESGSGPQAFRWTAAGGIVGMGDFSGGEFASQATGVSANGSVIVGTGVNSSDESRAFRWTSGSGLVALNAFFCFLCPSHSFGAAVSANGLVAVGGSNPNSDSLEAARWTGGGTSISGLGHLSGGGDISEARGASSTGSVIVGVSDATAGLRAFRWSSGSGIVALPDVPGALVDAAANDVSDDGNVIVGAANASAENTVQPQAVRWLGPSYSSAQLLGTLPGAPFPTSEALGVSANGAIVVGTANNADGDDSAFVWDATHGMRELKPVLEEEYGLDLGDWVLREARSVSNVNANGEFWITGAGTNPSGNPEGWVALLSLPACNDGINNDGDGGTDYPADPQCNSKGDRSETPDCGDGLDNDGDGPIDFPADTGCTSASDRTEKPDCSDGIDNDGDGPIDLADPGCRNANSPIENPACQNGIDDDGDGPIDFPADAGCVAADDRSEIADCSDGIDNDGDGQTDSPSDPDCTGVNDPAEDAQCDDRVDNDGDFVVDYPAAYPNCQSAADTLEKQVCSDGLDNDADGPVDFPADAGCASAKFASEAPVAVAVGDVLVLDRRSRTLFRLNLATGAQTLLSAAAQLGDPQGVEVSPGGHVVVADPAGLLEVAPSTGAQRRFSDALDTNLALQLDFEGGGAAALVLESGGITQVPFVFGGIAPQTPLLTLPVPGVLSIFVGDSIAREASGALLVTGFGVLGDGIFRVGATGAPVTKVTPGFSGDTWMDLAVEASGNILAAGTRFGVGTGVFRVNPATGARTSLSSGAPWVDPASVAVGTSGQVYVGDAGTCSEASCSGAQVVQVDPTTGARLFVRSGGFITGETDIAVIRAKPACSNGVDDDGDTLADFPFDFHCRSFEDASELPDCGNGLDDDGDGATDFPADIGCASATGQREDPACSDGLDNDGDGRIDWDGGPGAGTPDPQCAATPSKTKESANSCGVGAEIALALAALAARARRLGAAKS